MEFKIFIYDDCIDKLEEHSLFVPYGAFQYERDYFHHAVDYAFNSCNKRQTVVSVERFGD